LRLDAPLGHPEFGKLDICKCQDNRIAQNIKSRLFSISRLNELTHLTFESFKPRGRKDLAEMQADSLEFAHHNSEKYAKTLDGWILFQGDTGCGKTHLAAAIANHAVGNGVPTLFLTVPDLLDNLRSTYGDETVTFDERVEEIRKAQLIVLDDFGTQNATNWAQEKLFQIINYRYINRLSTVITTNLSLDEIEERIRSRLRDIELVKRIRIKAPDFRHPKDEDSILFSPKLKACIFQNFSLRKNEKLDKDSLESVQEALHVSKVYSEQPQGWLVITGDYGCGKTHLAAAIGHQSVLSGLSPMFMDVPSLLDYLRSTFSPNSTISYDKRFSSIRTASLLILDDFGTHSATPWAKEKIYQILNYRYNMELPTVVTISADALEGIDPRIRSRMLDYRLCTLITITAPPYHGAPKRPSRKK